MSGSTRPADPRPYPTKTEKFTIDLATAEVWGKISSNRTLPIAIRLLAATALAHDLTLVTRNTKDIAGTGVRYLNPFER